MANKLKNGNYACGYCKKEYSGRNGQQQADECKESHDLIYLQLSKDDLQRLLMFIFSKDERILGEKLVDRLQSYMKGSFNLELMKVKDGTKEV